MELHPPCPGIVGPKVPDSRARHGPERAPGRFANVCRDDPGRRSDAQVGPVTSSRRDTMRDLGTKTLVLAGGLIFGTAALADGMTHAQYEAAEAVIEADHEAAKKSCEALSGHAEDVCEAKSGNDEDVCRKEAKAARTHALSSAEGSAATSSAAHAR